VSFVQAVSLHLNTTKKTQKTAQQVEHHSILVLLKEQASQAVF